MLERCVVRLFFALVVVFAFRMTWEAAYLRGRESVYDIQQQAAETAAKENCYADDCSDHKAKKPKGGQSVSAIPNVQRHAKS